MGGAARGRRPVPLGPRHGRLRADEPYVPSAVAPRAPRHGPAPVRGARRRRSGDAGGARARRDAEATPAGDAPAEPACDAPEGGPIPRTVSVAASEARAPWELVFQRTARGWRLTRATQVLP